MPFPIAALTGKTGTGDTIIAPGCPAVLVNGKPAACLAYALHKRAAVWWGYNVLLSLFHEPPAPPAAEAGAPELKNVPEADAPGADDTLAAVNAAFEKVKNLGSAASAPDTDPEAAVAEAEKTITDALAQIDAYLAQQPQDVKDVLQEVQIEIDAVFKQNTGMTQNEYWDYITKMDFPDTNAKSTALEDSLAKDAAAMEAENAAFKKEMAAQFPPMNPEILQQRIDHAMKAVLAWCLSPDESNSLTALKAGNAIEDQPAGTLAQAAFWSYGDLAIGGASDCVVKTPPGLAASGVGIVIMQAISAAGGSLSPKERGAAYLQLGLEIAQGKHNWSAPDSAKVASTQARSGSDDEKIEYEKWNG